jgi:histidinol-phosphate aminotransferase
MYRVLTEARPARVVAVARGPAAAGYGLDADALRLSARDADLVWLCSPNNPTALPEREDAIASLLDSLADDAQAVAARLPAVVLDEAYAEFAGGDLVRLRARYPRLLVVRTLSKAYGLAGFRVGFGIGSAETIARLARFRPPGSVSTVSATVATEALRRPDDMRANVAAIVAERDRLAAALSDAGWSVGPSSTNFLLVDFGGPARASALAEALLRRGLVPRTFAADHPLAGHLRLTVRTPDEDDRLIELAVEGATREAT